jgi:hypothetical protein
MDGIKWHEHLNIAEHKSLGYMNLHCISMHTLMLHKHAHPNAA